MKLATSRNFAALAAILLLAGCAPTGPTRPVPEAPEPIRESEMTDGYDASLAELRERELRGRIEALTSTVEQPDFEPDMVLALLIDLPLDDLERLQLDHANRPALSPWLDLAVSARARLLDDEALARDLDAWRQRYRLPSGLAADLREWIRAWRLDRPMPEHISVLLPGELPLAGAGEVLRDGLLARWLQLPSERRPRIDFIYLDSADEAAIGAHFEALDRGSDFLIGPLNREQIRPLLRLPGSGVPMLLLNRPPGETMLPDSSLPLAMLALPPEEEAELAAVRALVDEAERALVIRQNSDFGRRVASRFVETFELGGGRILQQVEYAPGEFDHTEQLSSLLEIDRSEARIQRISGLLGESLESQPQRRTDFDLVFLAARGGDARQLMPQLRFLDLEDAPVFATSDVWPGGDVGNDLDGIRLPVAPWLLDDHPIAEERLEAEALVPELKVRPNLSLLNALGRDALELAPWMQEMKHDARLYLPARTGRLRLADGIHFQRDLPWARVEGGRLVLDDSIR